MPTICKFHPAQNSLLKAPRTTLQSLILSLCLQLTGDLSPLASLTKLQSLNLEYTEVRKFAPLEPILPQLTGVGTTIFAANVFPAELLW